MYNLVELKKIFQEKKILVTGHTGFKGANLLVLLKKLGVETYGYALKQDENSLYDLLVKEGNILLSEEVIDDIRNFDRLYSFIKKIMPDYILHMAAQPLVLKSYDESRYTYDVNVMGTVNLFESIKLLKKESDYYDTNKLSILNVTTDKVYENLDLEDYAFKENDKLCGHDPYANSKSCSELVTYSYRKSFFDNTNIKISTARAGNVIGGGDISENRIIPDCIKDTINNAGINIRNLNSVRPYQYVYEPLIIYLNILAMQYENDKYIGVYNIGPDKDDCMKNIDLANKFIEYWNKDLDGFKKAYLKENCSNNLENIGKEMNFLRLDNSLIKKVFGYKKIYTNDEMIEKTVLLYKRILNKQHLLDYMMEQITF